MVVDLHRLQFLREVAARGTMTAAAEALSYTPSAVSQQLATLEKELGTALLERRGRTVALTPAGRVLVSESDAVFAAAEHAASAVEQVAGRIAGPIHVGAFQSAGARLVPAAFSAMRTEHPDLEVHFRQWSAFGLRELQLGHLDICLDQEYDVLPHRRHDGFDARLLLTEPVFLAVPRAADNGPSLADYRQHSWAMSDTDDECGRLCRLVCSWDGFDPDVRFHTDDLEVILQLVASGIAVGILPRLAAYRVPDEVALYPIAGAERRVKALTRPEATDRPAIQLVLDHLERAGAAVFG